MKRFLSVAIMITAAQYFFAQSDLQVLAVVKLNKNETITVKQLKTRVEAYQKQRGINLSIDDRKKVLDALIQEKLIVQAAQKAGISIPDSAVEQNFIQSVTQNHNAGNLSESELDKYIQENAKMSLEEYMKQISGMSVAEYKSYLKSQMIAQQYIISQRQSGLASVSPSDEEIRAFYELNKASFVWTDMVKLFVVAVPKINGEKNAQIKANELYNNFKDKKINMSQMIVESKKNNSGFQSGEVLVNKNQASAQQLGFSYQELIELFKKDKGYMTTVLDKNSSFIFCSIIKKYEAKLLSLSDIVQPETTVTVYDYIKQTLGQQKQMEYLSSAAQEISESLDKEANVERKKKDAELEKLLKW